MREDKVIKGGIVNPKKKEKQIKKIVIASQEIVGIETMKICLRMGINVFSNNEKN